MRLLAMLCMISLMVTACGEVEPIEREVAESQSGAATEAELQSGATTEPGVNAQAAERLKSEEPTPPGEERTIAFERPFAHSGPATLRVHAIRFMSRRAAGARSPALADFLEDDTQTLVSLEMEALNNSDQPFDWYPNQDALVIGDEQIDASLFVSEDVAGDNWQPGVRKEGSVHWESRQPFDQLVQLGSARLLISEAINLESFERVSDNFEITIRWQP